MLASADDLSSGARVRPLLLAALGLLACSGPDNLTDPVVSADHATSLTTSVIPPPGSGGMTGLGGTTAVGTSAMGGLGGTTDTMTGGTQSGTTATFDWGTTTYDVALGSALSDHQDHLNGTSCLMAGCHTANTFNVGGTVYLADGTTYSVAQLGIFMDGTLSTTYAGPLGNFFTLVPSTTGWATAQIALRTAAGTLTMPVNASASGNCNTCHDATNRIVTP